MVHPFACKQGSALSFVSDPFLIEVVPCREIEFDDSIAPSSKSPVFRELASKRKENWVRKSLKILEALGKGELGSLLSIAPHLLPQMC